LQGKPAIFAVFIAIRCAHRSNSKPLIQEEFGDGIMRAIDFDMMIERQPDPKGDRVKLTPSGKFLPYKEY
jgi:cyanate lyase